MMIPQLLFLVVLLINGAQSASLPRRAAADSITCHTNAECLSMGLPPLKPRIKRADSVTLEYTGAVQTYTFNPGSYQVYAAAAEGSPYGNNLGGKGTYANYSVTYTNTFVADFIIGGRGRNLDGTLSTTGGGGGGTFMRVNGGTSYFVALGGGGGATSTGGGLDSLPVGGSTTGRAGLNGGGNGGGSGQGGRGSTATTGYANCAGGGGWTNAGTAATALDHGQDGVYFSPAQGGGGRVAGHSGGLGEYKTLNNQAGGPIDPDNIGGNGGYGGGGGAALYDGGGGGGGLGGGGGGHDGGAGGGASSGLAIGTLLHTGADHVGDGMVIITPVVT